MKIPRWLWVKKYFDTGFGLTSYLKYFLAGVGLVTDNLTHVFWIGTGYAFLCLVLGYFWIKLKFVDKENEINNILNPFQQEVRSKIRKL